MPNAISMILEQHVIHMPSILVLSEMLPMIIMKPIILHMDGVTLRQVPSPFMKHEMGLFKMSDIPRSYRKFDSTCEITVLGELMADILKVPVQLKMNMKNGQRIHRKQSFPNLSHPWSLFPIE